MIFRLTMVEDFDVNGAIWKIGDNEYIVQKNMCGEDDLYWTDSLEEAQRESISEAEELVSFELHEGDDLIDLMTEHETLTMPRLKQLMEEQGFYKDDKWVIRKK